MLKIKDKFMEKRLIIALALSFLVLFGFQKIGKKNAPIQQTPTYATTQSQSRGTSVPEAATAPSRALAREEEKPADENQTRINTEKFQLTFSDAGGTLKELALVEYVEEGAPEVLLSVEYPAQRPFALRSALVEGLDRKAYQMIRGDGFLEYRLVEEDWLEVTKRFTFHKTADYIEAAISIKNISPRRTAFAYTISGPNGIKQTSKVSGRNFTEADALVDGKMWKAKSLKGQQEREGIISWVALKNRYFTAIMKPFNAPRAVIFKETKKKKIVTTLTSRTFSLNAGETSTDTYLFYAGPLSEARLGAVNEELKQIVDYGFFGGISKKLLLVLRFFHKIVKNWGLAIILLTLLINAILFPLTMKSFTSMHQMKKIQPHMQKLKELHKDNPQKLNKEMMALYKTYNVNPLGGCLPMLLQMPIFISLYQGLIRSVELKGAGFLWIKDLAQPDGVPMPFGLPVIGNSINILPLLMVVAMFFQQKFSQGSTPATGDQASQQKMMMFMFPLFFGFLFYKMPSGLVLYWLTNTILMSSEQAWISKRSSAE